MSEEQPAQARRAINFGPSLRRLARRMRPERARLAGVVVLAVVGVLLGAVGPLILGRATDIATSGLLQGVTPSASTIDFTRLGLTLLLALGVYLVSGLLLWWQGLVLNAVVQRTVRRLRDDVEAKLNRLPLRYFDDTPRGDLLSRVTNDIDNLSQSLQQTMSQLLNSLLTLLGVLAMMLVLSPLLTLVALISIPISIGVTVLIGRRSQRLFVETWRSTGSLNSVVEESYTGHALVKVFGRTAAVEKEFGARNDALFRASFGSQFISGIIMPTMMFVGNLNYVVIAVVGALRISSGAMSLGEVQAFIQYSRQFTQPLTQAASMANLLQSGVASAERVFQVLDEPEQEPDRDGTLPATRGHVRFEHVWFSYSPGTELITDLDLDVRPGRTVAIVGPTGAGKTTLVNLLMRFYELDSGRITLDGVDIATVPREVLRSRIAMVLQDTWLFGGTIWENIAYGRPEASEQEILAAAQATYVDRFVHALPHGYQTVIDEEGSGVSAGEKQLITIARAFLADPALLILDEATSSVDTRTESLVQQAMVALRAQRTSFVIAHRLSTIRDADTILVMEHGNIVEQGSPAELMAADGAYARLSRAQFAGVDQD